MNVYVVRTDDFVEFRVGTKAPQPYTSEVVRKIKTTRQVWSNRTFTYVTKDVTEPFHMKQTFYVGGKVLASCRVGQYQKLVGFPQVHGDGVARLPKECAEKVLKASWRSRRGWL